MTNVQGSSVEINGTAIIPIIGLWRTSMDVMAYGTRRFNGSKLPEIEKSVIFHSSQMSCLAHFSRDWYHIVSLK